MSAFNLHASRPHLLSWRARVELVGLRILLDQNIIELKSLADSDILKNWNFFHRLGTTFPKIPQDPPRVPRRSVDTFL